MTRLDRMLALVRRHRPNVRLIDKHRVPWMRALGIAMRPFMADFMNSTTVVLGDHVYLPCPPERLPGDLLAQILAHELVHQLDQASLGPLFYLSYAGVPLPMGRTMRAWWERRAYAVDLMLAYEDGGEMGLRHARQRIVRLFAGPSYGWMWAGRRSADRFLDPVVQEILDGSLQQRSPYSAILAAWGNPDYTPSEEVAWAR